MKNALKMTVAFAVVGISVASSGCGRTKPSYPSTTLEGDVTIANKPVEKGKVEFMPQDVKNGLPISATIVDGRYHADQVSLGKVVATLHVIRETGRSSARGTSTAIPEYENLVPPAYREGIELDVTTDTKNKDFHL
jgi:hypothetical protein